MPALNWAALDAVKLRRDPFEHAYLADCLTAAAVARLPAEYPDLPKPGSFSLKDARPGPVLSEVIAELESDRFRTLMSKLFEVDLSQRATMVTLRGACGPRDGFVHTDSKSKILSLLLYLNEGWTGGEGQLRLLRSEHDLASPAVEIPASMGSMVVFKRSEASWHGHTPFDGPRRVLQFNYVRSERTNLVSDIRHRVSAALKGKTPAM